MGTSFTFSIAKWKFHLPLYWLVFRVLCFFFMLFADNECSRPLLPASLLLLSRLAFLLFFIAYSLIGFASGVNIEASLLSSAVKQLRRKVPLLGRRESITRFTDDQTAGTFLVLYTRYSCDRANDSTCTTLRQRLLYHFCPCLFAAPILFFV